MELQYLTDGNGNTTGVFIPIEDWKNMIKKFKSYKTEEAYSIPETHQAIVKERIEKYNDNPEEYLTWKEIEKDLNLE